ncbi:hypothetical protein [Streptomyces sp. CA-106110]|uniref:hypothetical protein n=1 Tax=Streptomyces sp. CA-106110 TaxID=3240044 RepID=UPI003D8F3698
MTLPRTVADVLGEHTLFEIECIDRMYLNVYVPQLQGVASLVALPVAKALPYNWANVTILVAADLVALGIVLRPLWSRRTGPRSA